MMKSICGITWAFLILIPVFGAHAKELKTKANTGTSLLLLDSAEKDPFAYALYQVPSQEKDIDLVLILRNTGAKHIDSKGVDASHFTVTDDAGAPLKIWSVTGMDGIGFQSIAVVHIYIQDPTSAKKKYTLELRPRLRAIVPIAFKTKAFRLKEEGKTLSVAELKKAKVIGLLNQPLGTIVTVEGVYKDMTSTKAKADDGRIELEVHSVNGKPLSKPIRFRDFYPIRKSARKKQKGEQRFRMVGYEGGRFKGEPKGIEKYDERPAIAKAHLRYRFYTEFKILRVEK